jgi:hypothetical protein
MRKANRSCRGFSLIEILITLGLGIVILAATTSLLRSSLDLVDTTTLVGEMHQNARVGLNLVARDLSMAGWGIPTGGIQLPEGGSAKMSQYACDEEGCYVDDNSFDDRRLYSITPGSRKGPVVAGNSTDAVTMLYKDPESHFDRYPLTNITSSGSQITFDPATNPAPDDPTRGIKKGDILIVWNTGGYAAAVATNVSGFKVDFANNDPLDFNQPSADHGNIAGLCVKDDKGNPKKPIEYPELTFAFKVSLISYFLEADAATNARRLMRHVGAHAPVAVAENVLDFQVTYDIFDESGAGMTGNLDDADDRPNLIRKVNLFMTVRTPRLGSLNKRYEYSVLRTSVSARNLAFVDRYPE